MDFISMLAWYKQIFRCDMTDTNKSQSEPNVIKVQWNFDYILATKTLKTALVSN